MISRRRPDSALLVLGELVRGLLAQLRGLVERGLDRVVTLARDLVCGRAELPREDPHQDREVEDHEHERRGHRLFLAVHHLPRGGIDHLAVAELAAELVLAAEVHVREVEVRRRILVLLALDLGRGGATGFVGDVTRLGPGLSRLGRLRTRRGRLVGRHHVGRLGARIDRLLGAAAGRGRLRVRVDQPRGEERDEERRDEGDDREHGDGEEPIAHHATSRPRSLDAIERASASACGMS